MSINKYGINKKEILLDCYIYCKIPHKTHNKSITRIGKIIKLLNNKYIVELTRCIDDINYEFTLYKYNMPYSQQIEIDFNSIEKICKPSNKLNIYGISESDITIGSVIKFVDHDRYYIRIVSNILPDVIGSYNFIVDDIDDNNVIDTNDDDEYKNTITDMLNIMKTITPINNNNDDDDDTLTYRGLHINNAIGIKNIIDVYNKDVINMDKLNNITLINIMQLYYKKFTLRKVSQNSRYQDKFKLGISKFSTVDGFVHVDKYSDRPIYHYSDYVGSCDSKTIRQCMDNFIGLDITYDSSNCSVFNYMNLSNHPSILSTHSKITVPPIKESLLCGIVKKNNKGTHEFYRWTTVTPQFLFFITLILYRDNPHITTKNLTTSEIDDKLRLINIKELIVKYNNNEITIDTLKKTAYKTLPYFNSVETILPSTFYIKFYNIINTYSIDKFKTLLTDAEDSFIYHNYPPNIYHHIALIIKDIAWYLFNDN